MRQKFPQASEAEMNSLKMWDGEKKKKKKTPQTTVYFDSCGLKDIYHCKRDTWQPMNNVQSFSDLHIQILFK